MYIRPGSNAGIGTGWPQMTTTTGNDGQTWLLGPELNTPTDRFIYRWPVAGGLTSAGGAGTSLTNYNGTIWTTAGGASWRYISDGNWQAVAAPLATSGSFDATTRQAVVVTLADEGRPFYTRSSFSIVNKATNQPVAGGTLSWNTTGTQATIDMTNLLPDGNYDIRLGVATVGSFFVLAGDFNRDRTVNFVDLLALASNYSLSGKTNAQGDVNYDGNVNFPDLLALAGNYNKSQPAGVVAAASAPTVFASSPIRDQDDESSVLA
ncbi:MAG: dockerin type I domain-containing protein [Tepidisphaeraceae bacterium]